MHLKTDLPAGRRVVPDHALPDALCVPLSNFTNRAALEAVAVAAAERVGVILITPDPAGARELVAAQAHPDHFGIVSGYYDSPWFRDHAPIAVEVRGGVENIRPARPETERKHDPRLFATIFPGAMGPTPHVVAAGNLVGGPGGLAISTDTVLPENGFEGPDPLTATARMLGISDWVFVPAFSDDLSQHSDCMTRLLAPDLLAFCDRQDDEAAVSAEMAARLRAARPDITLVPLPCENREGPFNSPLNWIQLDDLLLVPDFETADPHAEERQRLLESLGFEVRSIPCGTAGLGGGLHCLTASIFSLPPGE